MNSSEHVADLLFISKQCVVSEAASQLMKLVHQTLQVIKSENLTVKLLFHI